MTTDRDFDRIAMAWLADGPDELSDRVIDAAVDQIHVTRQRRAIRVSRRLPTMTTPARVAAAAVIGVLVFGGALIFFGRPGKPAVSGASASPPASASTASENPVPALTQVVTSPRHGYSVHVPADWTITPATAQWTTGIDTLFDDPGLDKIGNAQARLAVASEPLGTTTPEAWLAPYCRSGATGTACGRKIAIGNATGYVDEDGKSAEGGTVTTGGVIFDAAVTADGRGYIFILDGHVDRALFDAILKTVAFDGASAIDLPPLTGTFTSPTFGYTIGTATGWAESQASDGTDQVAITGTDSKVFASSEVLPKGTTFDAWLVGPHQAALDGNPAGCDGGDPPTWPAVPVGPETGRLQMLCNLALAYVEAGGRVYTFGWGNDTFTTDSHLGLASWKELLKSVTFDPGAAH
jgi:hypothetical protein